MSIPSVYQPDCALVAPLPDCAVERQLIWLIRRMAAKGLRDGSAMERMMAFHGIGWRRPWLLVQTLVVELSRHARQPIIVAPCCCGQLTRHEAQLLDCARSASSQPKLAGMLLADLTGQRQCGSMMSALTAAYAGLTLLPLPLDD